MLSASYVLPLESGLPCCMCAWADLRTYCRRSSSGISGTSLRRQCRGSGTTQSSLASTRLGEGEKTPFIEISLAKCHFVYAKHDDILPRQARDKRRGKLRKEWRVLSSPHVDGFFIDDDAYLLR